MAEAGPGYITICDLVKRINRKTILNKLSLQIQPAESVVILGPNGAGKTTLLRILSSLMRPDSGYVRVNGYALPQESTAVRRLLGFVSHQPLLYGDLSAEENLRFYARLYGVEQADQRIEYILTQVGLLHRAGDLVRTYSRGMQQRLTIGRAILHKPPVLLLDEPFTGLDIDASDTLGGIIKQMTAGGCTLLMTSHDIGGLENLASRFVIMDNGQIIAALQKSDFARDGLAVVYRQVIQRAHGGDAD